MAVAIRNRWRRQKVEPEMKGEIGPKNIMMIGPTGVGKTEIARRLATLTGAPFIKVEATKYTEVGYYGRDVESMIRDLVENAIGIVRTSERKKVEDKATELTEERLVTLIEESLLNNQYPPPPCKSKRTKKNTTTKEDSPNQEYNPFASIKIDAANPLLSLGDIFKTLEEITKDKMGEADKDSISTKNDKTNSESDRNNIDNNNINTNNNTNNNNDNNNNNNDNNNSDNSDNDDNDNEDQSLSQDPEKNKHHVDRSEILLRLLSGEYEKTMVTILAEQKMAPVIMGGIGMESMENDLQSMFDNIIPKRNQKRELPVEEARKVIFEQECERLINKEKVNSQAIELAENLGIIFIDELDKIVASDNQHGADVSRQGVQRDLLPIVEGTTIQTKYGFVSTEHVLFIAAGAFHRSKPTDLMPELQGRFPIRVELDDLSSDDFIRILKEPHGALTKQYKALMKTEGVDLEFTEDAVAELAQYAYKVNQTTMNIGARRLYTIMERLLEELSFEAPDMKMGKVVVNAAYVKQRLGELIQDEDLNKFIL